MPKPLNRFLAKVQKTSRCWYWAGATNPEGYGVFWWEGRLGRAHRFSYETYVGAIPEGLDVDHLCRNRICVKPTHLEPVTRGENLRRGLVGVGGRLRQQAKTHCPYGHEYDITNTRIGSKGERNCRTCARERTRRKRREFDATCNTCQEPYQLKEAA